MFPSPVHRILAVDDIPDNLFMLETILATEGYEVEIADSGRSALNKIQNSPPDLVLLDVMMPDMSGYEVAQRIRQNQALPNIPILLITAYDEINLHQSLAVGADDLIRKPINFEELLTRVREFLQFNNQGADRSVSGYSDLPA